MEEVDKEVFLGKCFPQPLGLQVEQRKGFHPGELIDPVFLAQSSLGSLHAPQTGGHPVLEHQGRMFPLTIALTAPGFRLGKTSRANTIYFKRNVESFCTN